MGLSKGNIDSLLEADQHLLDRDQVGCQDGLWGRSPRLCAASARSMSLVDLVRGLPSVLPALPASAALAHVVGHLPVGSQGLGFRWGDQGTVDVSELVGGTASEHRPGALAQVGSDNAEGLEVAGAALDDLDGVEAGELGVEMAGVVGGAEQGGAKQARAGLGHGLAFAVGLAGLGGPGSQAGEGAEAGATGEAAGVADQGGQSRSADGGDTGQAAGELVRVDLEVGLFASRLVGGQFGLGGLREANLGDHLGGTVIEGEGRMVTVELEREVGGVEPGLGALLAEMPAGGLDD